MTTFDGTAVTSFKRVMGRRGVSYTSLNTLDVLYALGRMTPMNPDGVSPDNFEVQITGHGWGDQPLLGVQKYGTEYLLAMDADRRRLLHVSNTVVNTWATTDLGMNAFAVAPQGGQDILYYCADNGELRRRNLSVVDSPAETSVSLQIPGATCSGRYMTSYQRSGQTYLMMIYIQNSLKGILELRVN